MIIKKTYNYRILYFQSHIDFYPELAFSQEPDLYKNWLQLKNPKVLYMDKINTNNSISSINTSTNLTDVGVEDLGLILNRVDKKSKNHNKLIDPLEYKKNKSKLKKKIRTKIHINDDDDSLDTNTNQTNLRKVNQSLALSIMRPTNTPKKVVNAYKINSLKARKKYTQNKVYKNKETITQEKQKPDKVLLTDPISIENLSSILKIPAAEIIKSLFMKGISVTVNQVVDMKLANSIAHDYGIEVEDSNNQEISFKLKKEVSRKDDQRLQTRSPIVTVFGHVDHGKTTLLDIIRSTQAPSIESGGITQKIAAYDVNVNGNKVVFLDTPGHEAFASTRLLGIQVTDIGILVIAADDELQPQSIEAINYLQKSQTPFIVAINKIDKPMSNVEKIYNALAKFNILSIEGGGNTPVIEISALQNIKIDLLLLAITKIIKERTFQANLSTPASGTVLDAYLDKKKGPVAHIIVQNGTLHLGDHIITSNAICKVRNIIQKKQENIKSTGPSSVVAISGFSFVPKSGTLFRTLDNPKQAKKKLAELQKVKSLEQIKTYQKLNTRMTLDVSPKQGYRDQKKVNIVLKIDSEGTIEAIIQALRNIPQDKVQLNIVSLGVGEVSPTDISLASVSGSLLLSFNSPASHKILALAAKLNIVMAHFKVIYDLIDYVEKAMLNFVDIEYNERSIGRAIVETVFVVSKGNVAGCMVISGKLKRNTYIRVHRSSDLIYEGKLSSLKRIKEDVEEVTLGNECGVLCNKFDSWQTKDIISTYELVEKKKTL